MLRYSIAQSRQVLSNPVRQRTTAQWLSRVGPASCLSGQRFFADSKPFAYASSDPSSGSSSSPPPPKPARKTGRFRRFLLYLVLTSGLAYGGGVFLALKSDTFHDLFTDYVPYGEECVLYFEERDFYRRFPHASKRPSHESTPWEERVTIPSKSGLSWKVAEEEQSGSDVSKKGPHMSATEAHKTEELQKGAAAETKAEERNVTVSKAKEATEAKRDTAAKGDTATKVDTATKGDNAAKTEEKEDSTPIIATVDLAQIRQGGEEIVQDLVKSFNDVISVIGADEKAGQYLAHLSKAKEEVQKIGDKIIAIRDEARAAAQDEIKRAHATFDESARELIRRFDETRTNDIAQYREEFETEREKLARAYQLKIETELQRAQEIAEQRLKNELVEQAIELNRKYLNDVKDLVEKEREGRLSKLNDLTASVKDLEELTTGWQEVIDTNLKTQQLQVAVDAVRTVLERSDMPRPFIRELVAVKELAADDEVVEAAIASINPTAYQRGIPSTSQLIERFRRVAGEVRKASLLPENAGIASHAASVVLSRVTFKKDAVADSNDVESILTRTENLLEQGSIDAAAREMNGLQGWAKILSKDWLADVRKVLEVRQALEVIETQARLQCLRVE